MRRVTLVVALLFAVAASADDTPHYKSIVAIFRIQKDGSLQMVEKVIVEAKPNESIERAYWQDFTQHVTINGSARPDDRHVLRRSTGSRGPMDQECRSRSRIRPR